MLFLFKKLRLPFISFLLISCGGGNTENDNTSAEPAIEIITTIPVEPPIAPTSPVVKILPIINQVNISTSNIERYKKIEMAIDLSAQYSNPYNQEEISINAVFTSSTNKKFTVPAFWDGESRWLIRFTPSLSGLWSYTLTITDIQGSSLPFSNTFNVNDSTHSGWLQTGKQFNENYSNKYLVHHKGTPFYGVGHADAFIVERSFNSGTNDTLEHLIVNMKEANENYFVWWPQFYFSLVERNYDDFDVDNLKVIDTFLKRLEEEELFVIFTLWDHSQLRDNNHPWTNGNWFNSNGFSQLSSLTDFFITDEAWLWQRNLYRYIIARYSYSPSLAMWQTVSEIDGTNAFEQTNVWHKKVNDYFVGNDPYQHPTTASMAGDIIWDEGNKVMDVAQVHIYQDLIGANDKPLITKTASVIADYTQNMWENNNKPNWIGEFGAMNRSSLNENVYPELFHNVIWAALSNGAALTPAEWNDFFDWGVMTTVMKNHIRFLNTFVQPIPLAQWNPSLINITDNNNTTKSWGVLGNEGGVIWVQDMLVEGLNINDIRQQRVLRDSVSIFLADIKSGQFKVTPFNTWNGEFGNSFTIDCGSINTNGCKIDLPNFLSDIALRLDKLN